MRKNPFSLEVLAAIKAASCDFKRLPRMIKEEVKKYQDLDELIKSFYAPRSLPTLWFDFELLLVCRGILIWGAIMVIIASVIY